MCRFSCVNALSIYCAQKFIVKARSGSGIFKGTGSKWHHRGHWEIRNSHHIQTGHTVSLQPNTNMIFWPTVCANSSWMPVFITPDWQTRCWSCNRRIQTRGLPLYRRSAWICKICGSIQRKTYSGRYLYQHRETRYPCRCRFDVQHVIQWKYSLVCQQHQHDWRWYSPCRLPQRTNPYAEEVCGR